jgi:hypothetical protein
MIVCDFYEGDDIELAWKQHDIYKHALSIIIQGYRVHFINAYQIVGGLDSFKLWSPDQSIDHRTLQNATTFWPQCGVFKIDLRNRPYLRKILAFHLWINGLSGFMLRYIHGCQIQILFDSLR